MPPRRKRDALLSREIVRERHRRHAREPYESPSINMTNATGGDLVTGDVVVIDPTSDRSVIFATKAGDANPLVIQIGGVDGEVIKCYHPGAGVERITCDGPAVTTGNLIVTSATNKLGKPLVGGEEPESILGVAMEAGTGVLAVMILGIPAAGNAGLVPPFPAAGYWSRDVGSGLLSPTTLSDKVGIGTAAADVWLHVSSAAAEIRVETPDATDPTLSFKTTNTVHQLAVYLDEDAAINLLSIGDALFADGTNRRVGIGYETAPDVTLGLLDSGAATRIRLTADANQHAFITFTPDSGGGDAFSIGYDDVGDVLSLTDSAFPSEAGLHLTQGSLVGIGTNTVPHGGIGAAGLAIEGPNANVAGPHVQLTTASDDYPLIQLFAWTHDNVGLLFDMYNDGAWKSSDAGSNALWRKTADLLRLQYSTGNAQGAVIASFIAGLELNMPNEHLGVNMGVGIGPATASMTFDVNGATLLRTVADPYQSEQISLYIGRYGRATPLVAAERYHYVTSRLDGVGSPNLNYLSFYVSTGAVSPGVWTQALTLTGAGRVGITEPAPATSLHINQAGAAAGIIIEYTGQEALGIFQGTDRTSFWIDEAAVGLEFATNTTANIKDINWGARTPVAMIHDTGGFAIGTAFYSIDPGADNVIIEGIFGLGIAIPLTNVHIYEDNADTEPAFRIEQDGAGDAAMRYLLTGGQSWSTGIDNSIAGDPFIIAAGPALATNPYLTILTTGEVGIGTVAPGSILTLGGAGLQTISRSIDSGSLLIAGATGISDGAYFNITGINYAASPGKGSAEFVIRENTGAGASMFNLFSYDGAATWTKRFSMVGSTGFVGIGATTATELLQITGGNVLVKDSQPDILLNFTGDTQFARLLFQEDGLNIGVFQVIGSTFATASRRGDLEFFATADANDIAFFVNGSLETMTFKKDGKIGVHNNAPDVLFHILEGSAELRIETADATDPVLSFKTTNTAHQIDISLDEDAAIDVLSIAGALYVDSTNSRVGVGIAAPLAKTHIDQSVSDAAIPVLTLDQADISEGFVNFIGSDRGVIPGATNSVGSVRVELGGVVYRLSLYVDA